MSAVVWRKSQVTKLRQAALDAQATIAKLVDDSGTRLSGDSTVWGQFLDAPRNAAQHGVYGTSAAIQILTSAGHPSTNSSILGARKWMPGLEPDPSSPGVDPTDTGLTIKLAAAVSAAEVDSQGEYVRTEAAEDQLISQVIDDNGWGNYYYTDGTDSTARPLPTAHALLALSRSKTFATSSTCTAILVWLSKQLSDREDLPAHEAALGALALLAYPGQAHKVPAYEDTLKSVASRLALWATTRQNSALGESAAFHFEAPSGAMGAPHNHYFFYLPDLIVARLFLQLHPVQADTSAYILRVVQETVANVKTNGGFRTRGSGRVASVDQLEVYCTLHAFSESAGRDPSMLLPPILRFLSATLARRIISSAIFIALGFLLSLIALDEGAPTFARAGASVAVALLLAVIGTIWVTWAGSA